MKLIAKPNDSGYIDPFTIKIYDDHGNEMKNIHSVSFKLTVDDIIASVILEIIPDEIEIECADEHVEKKDGYHLIYRVGSPDPSNIIKITPKEKPNETS